MIWLLISLIYWSSYLVPSPLSLALKPALAVFQNSGIWDLQVIHVDAYDWTLLLSIGLLGTLAHLLMTWSLRYAPSATVAPMQYLEIPFATVIGFLVFGDLPNPLASVGILITILAGLYVVLRERASAQSALGSAKTSQPQS